MLTRLLSKTDYVLSTSEMLLNGTVAHLVEAPPWRPRRSVNECGAAWSGVQTCLAEVLGQASIRQILESGSGLHLANVAGAPHVLDALDPSR